MESPAPRTVFLIPDTACVLRRESSFLARRIDEKYRMKESVTGHRTGLTDRLLKLFAPRQPLEFWSPEVSKPKAVPLSGLAAYTDKLASPGDPEYKTMEVTEADSEPRLFQSPEVQYQARIEVETKPERDMRAAAEAKDRTLAANEAAASERDVSKDPSIEGDPFKTLFVGHLSYETTERKLRREFEEFGPIHRIRIVHDKHTGKGSKEGLARILESANMSLNYLRLCLVQSNNMGQMAHRQLLFPTNVCQQESPGDMLS